MTILPEQGSGRIFGGRMFLPSPACGRGKDAEGGEGEGL